MSKVIRIDPEVYDRLKALPGRTMNDRVKVALAAQPKAKS